MPIVRRGMKLAMAIMLGFVLVFGTISASPAPAEASPWNCKIGGTGKSRSAQCFNGTGKYRVVIHCIGPLGASSRFVYGPYMSMGSGLPSGAWCRVYETVGTAYAGTID